MADGPANGQQAQRQGQAEQRQQLQQRVPDFLYLVVRVDGQADLLAIFELHGFRWHHLGIQPLAQPAAMLPFGCGYRLCPGRDALDPDVPEAVLQAAGQGLRVAAQAEREVVDDLLRGIHFALHVVRGLAQQDAHAHERHRREEQRHQQVGATKGIHHAALT